MCEWVKLREPNLDVKIGAGWCLGYVSRVLGINSGMYSRASYAWAGGASSYKEA